MIIHLLLLAGGEGRRLGGRSKADLNLGIRLLDFILSGTQPFIHGYTVVIAPEQVEVPPGIHRTYEDPPLGGPLAGLGAGVSCLEHIDPNPEGDQWIAVAGVDYPGFVESLPHLIACAQPLAGRDGVVLSCGTPTAYDQFLMGLYRRTSLVAHLGRLKGQGGGTLAHRSVRKGLAGLDLVRLPVKAHIGRDIDTTEDLDWWRERLVRD